MKVSEAKTKVCPFIQHTHGQNEVQNINCICGDCMAWVCTKEKFITNINELDESWETFGIEDNCVSYCGVFIEREFLPEDEKEGYCQRLQL